MPSGRVITALHGHIAVSPPSSWYPFVFPVHGMLPCLVMFRPHPPAYGCSNSAQPLSRNAHAPLCSSVQLAGPGETPFVIAYAPSSVYTGGITSPNAGVTLSAEQVGCGLPTVLIEYTLLSWPCISAVLRTRPTKRPSKPHRIIRVRHCTAC